MTSDTPSPESSKAVAPDGPSAPDPDHGELNPLEVAHRIGQRLAATAQWTDDACTWNVMVPDPTGRSRDSVPEAASGLLYQGSAGIAWFLGQLAGHTDDADMHRAAVGGMTHALHFAEGLPDHSFGMHSGRVGVAWAAAQLAQPLGQPHWLDAARQLCRPLHGKASQDGGLDVIGGAAGAIPALLELHHLLADPELLQLAQELGEQLLATAHHELTGWSWATLPRSSYRNLNGFAHGASGVGLALLELAKASADGRYRFAAEMAFLYERSCYSEAHQNWPDLRIQALSEIYQFGRIPLLQQLIQEQRVPPYRPTYMTAWCHGSPGIGLARLRAWELTGHDLYLEEARLAMQSTDGSLSDEALGHTNYSLCHGASGNAELLLYGATLLADDDLMTRCRQVARRGFEDWEATGRPWPCGTMDSSNDPSLLIGEAGIGMFYLRLADPSLPSPLLLRPDHGDRPLPEDGFAELAERAYDAFFAAGRRRWHRLTDGAFELPPLAAADGPLERPPVMTAKAAFETFLESVDGSRRDLLADAWAVERAAFEGQHGIHDYTAEALRGLVRPHWNQLDTAAGRFRLAPDARLTATERPWHIWDQSDDEAPPEPSESSFLLLRKDHRLQAHAVGRLAAVMLDLLSTPQSLDQLVQGIAEAVGAEDPAAVAPTVEQQLAQLYVAEFIDHTAPSEPRDGAP